MALMQVSAALQDAAAFLSNLNIGQFDDAWVMLLILPAAVILWYLLKKNFVHPPSDIYQRRALTARRVWVFFLRLIIVGLLLVAIAGPYVREERTEKGDPFVKIISDKSKSFKVFNQNAADEFKTSVEKYFKTDLFMTGDETKSPLGDAIVQHLEGGGVLFLVSDGNVVGGTSFGDAALNAQRLNVSVNAIQLEAEEDDASIEISGPGKVSADVENSFAIEVKGSEDKQHRIRVLIDGNKFLEKSIIGRDTFITSFDAGYHTITAELLENDYFSDNNRFYKTVKVVEKPKILLVSEKDSPLKYLFSELYIVETATDINENNLEQYYAIILDDVHASRLEGKVSALSNYLLDKNGLVVFGGMNSFDRGEYKGSFFETLLPTTTATAGKQGGDVGIIVIIDISGSTQLGDAVAIEKALAINVLGELGSDNKVGIIAFDTQSYVVMPPTYLFQVNRPDLESKITSLKSGGGTLIGAGLSKAIELLGNTAGSKNIVLISDGQTQGKDEALAAAQIAADKGIRIFTIGVGEKTNEIVMKQLADIGSGTYFQATQANRLSLIFGEADEGKKKDVYNAVVFDSNHFITEGVNLNAWVYGFNEVVPKSSAKLLVTTDSGDPLVAAWRYGLGRVVTIATDDGAVYAGDLLDAKNSKLLVRSLNWVIGDPERKNPSYVDIPDTKMYEDVVVTFKSRSEPKSGEAVFYKIDEDLYRATIPSKEEGFQNLLGATFAVNYPAELSGIGIGSGLQEITAATNGKIFRPDQIKEMVEAVKDQSIRAVLKKWYYRWPFALAALILFLIDIFVRRVTRGR